MNKEFLESFQKFQIPLNQSYLKAFSLLELTLEKINNHQGILKILKTNPKGIYIHGLTGCGKTTLMNNFFTALNVPKINIHFHDYFLDISRLLNKYSVAELASQLSQKVKVLCFDEFFVESIADAKLLYELFEEMIKNGIIIVLTSNFAPESLYLNGFNRGVVFPEFSDFLSSNLQVIHLATNFDFRQNQTHKSTLIINELPKIENSETLTFNGHKIKCKKKEGSVIIEYHELFSLPRSVVEFVFICRNFDKIYIANFKKFTQANEDEAIRFRNFIDVAYLRNNIVFFEGEFEEADIFSHNLMQSVKFQRTYSRLCEMSSQDFLSQGKMLKRKWQKQAKALLETL